MSKAVLDMIRSMESEITQLQKNDKAIRAYAESLRLRLNDSEANNLKIAEELRKQFVNNRTLATVLEQHAKAYHESSNAYEKQSKELEQLEVDYHELELDYKTLTEEYDELQIAAGTLAHLVVKNLEK